MNSVPRSSCQTIYNWPFNPGSGPCKLRGASDPPAVRSLQGPGCLACLACLAGGAGAGGDGDGGGGAGSAVTSERARERLLPV